MYISFVSETNRRLFPSLNKHHIPEVIQEEDVNEDIEPAVKKLKTRHLKFVNSFVIEQAPKRVEEEVNDATHSDSIQSPGTNFILVFLIIILINFRKKCFL